MPAFRLSRRAASDLIEIARYTLERWGEEQATRYIDDLEACCRQLAHNPGLGRGCPDIRPGLYRMEHASHVLFYPYEKGRVLISRILHERMLPKRHQNDDKG